MVTHLLSEECHPLLLKTNPKISLLRALRVATCIEINYLVSTYLDAIAVINRNMHRKPT